jgi:hypothetical protein
MPTHRPARPAPRWISRLAALGACAAMLGATGCPVLFPEYSTHLGVAPATESYDPPPPPELHYVVVHGATIPPRTRDGRAWDEVLGHMPDPYLKLTVNGEELLKTNPESDTLTPTWKDSPKGNFPLKMGDELRIEVWDANALIDHPIGVKTVTLTTDIMSSPEQDIDFDGGLNVKFAIEPAKPIWGLGIKYELRTTSAYITKVLDMSPASRAGVKVGDQIIKLGGKDVSTMSGDQVTGLLNTIPFDGLRAVLVHDGGSTLEATLKEGPIYPLFKDYGDPTKPP